MHSTDIIDDGYLGSGKLLGRSIKKHGRINHVREVIEFCDDRKTLAERERQVVTVDLIKDPLCMNVIEGGLGNPPGIEVSFETRQRISAALKGHVVTENQRQKIREKRLGKTQGDVANQKTGEASRQRFQDHEFRSKHSDATREAMKSVDRCVLRNRQRHVAQYDLEGNLIERFSSIGAAAKAVGLSQSMVGHVLNGRASSSRGFIWKFINEEETKKAKESV